MRCGSAPAWQFPRAALGQGEAVEGLRGKSMKSLIVSQQSVASMLSTDCTWDFVGPADWTPLPSLPPRPRNTLLQGPLTFFFGGRTFLNYTK